jgi:hypothetical protein
MPIKRIIITADLLRPFAHDPARSESLRRIRWFEDLLRPVLETVVDLPIERLACEGDLAFSSLYANCGQVPSIESWAELYTGALPTRLRDRLLSRCRDAVVIGAELAPSLAETLMDGGVPVLDCMTDPLRFLDDIPLSWRTTDDSMRAQLARFRLDPFDVARRVGRIKAKTRWMPELPVPEGATLLLGQVWSDGALVDPQRRRMVWWDDYRHQLDAIAARGPILWRAHPHHPVQAPPVARVHSDPRLVNANFYQLLSHDHLMGVAAISSGGAIEARAFGKCGEHLLDRYAGIRFPHWGDPVPVLGHWMSPHFWRDVLSPLVATREDVPERPVEKDVFRRSMNCDWEFGWIDRVVAL